MEEEGKGESLQGTEEEEGGGSEGERAERGEGGYGGRGGVWGEKGGMGEVGGLQVNCTCKSTRHPAGWPPGHLGRGR